MKYERLNLWSFIGSNIYRFLFALVFSCTVFAQDGEVINLSDTIVGNQEQPTVLYIVPWKQAEDTTILYLPLDPKAMENLFGHVERVEHQRQIKYIEQLDASHQGSASN